MANLTPLNLGSGGDSVLDIDMAPFVSYPLTSGKLEATAIYVGSGLSQPPAPVTLTNPIPVQVQSGSAYLGSVFASGAYQLLSGAGAIGQLASGGFPIGTVGVTSGLVGVLSGAVQILSGSVTLGSGGQGVGSVGVSSGQISVSSGLVGVLSGSVGATASGSVQVSGVVGVSGQVAILSGQISISSGLVGVLSGAVQILSGSVTIGSGGASIGSVGVSSGSLSIQSGIIAIQSGLVGVLSGSIGATVSGSVQVSGNVGVSGSVQILSGAGAIGQLASGGFPIGTVGVTSGQISVSSGSILAGINSGLLGILSGSIGAQVSGGVIVSGNVGVSGSAQLLSGSAAIGIPETIFSPVAIGPASGQPYPMQGDGSGNLRVAVIGGSITALNTTSGSVQVSGIVGISGSVGVLSGQISVSSGLVGILSGSIGATVSGGVIVSGNVNVSGSVQLLSGSAWAAIVQGVFNPVAVGPASGQPYSLQLDGSGNLRTAIIGSITATTLITSGTFAIQSGLVGILSGNIGAQVSGAVIVSGNVGVSGSVQLLSGSAYFGVMEGVYSPVALLTPASGQAVALQTDAGGRLLIAGGNNPIGSVSISSGLVALSSGVGVLSGQISISSGNTSLYPSATNGKTIGLFSIGNNVSGTLVKGSAAQLFGFSIFNTQASGAWLKIYDVAFATDIRITVGPSLVIPVTHQPSADGTGATAINLANQFVNFGDIGLQFLSGIGIACTGQPANADITALSGTVSVAVFYK